MIIELAFSLIVLMFSSSTDVDTSSDSEVQQFYQKEILLGFNSTTIVTSSSSTITRCELDRSGRCVNPEIVDYARFFDRAVPLVRDETAFNEPVLPDLNSSDQDQQVQINSGSNSLSKYYTKDGVRIADSHDSMNSMSFSHTICDKVYDVLFLRCFNGFEP